MRANPFSKALIAVGATALFGLGFLIMPILAGSEPLKAEATNNSTINSTPLVEGCAFDELYFPEAFDSFVTNGEVAFNLYPSNGGNPISFTSVRILSGNIPTTTYLYCDSEQLDAVSNSESLSLSTTATGEYLFGIANGTNRNPSVIITFDNLVFVDEINENISRYPATPTETANRIENYKIPLERNQKFSALYIKNPSNRQNPIYSGVLNSTDETGNIFNLVAVTQGSEFQYSLYVYPIGWQNAQCANKAELIMAGQYTLFGKDRVNPESANAYIRLAFWNTHTISAVGSYYETLLKEDVFIPYDDPYLVGYRENYDRGYADGYEAGKADGIEEGYSSGYTAGNEDGYSDGYEAGYAAGRSYRPDSVDITLPTNWYPYQTATYVSIGNYPSFAEEAQSYYGTIASGGALSSTANNGTFNFYTDFRGQSQIYNAILVEFRNALRDGVKIVNQEGEAISPASNIYYISLIGFYNYQVPETTGDDDIVAQASMTYVNGDRVVLPQIKWIADEYRKIHITADEPNATTGNYWTASIETDAEGTTTNVSYTYEQALLTSGVSASMITEYYSENLFSMLTSAFESASAIMNVQILPYLTLGSLIFVPLIVTIIIACVKILGK